MRNIALFLTYEGTAYHGWQMQKNLATVQQTLEKAIAMIVHHDVHVTGCGRTDAGVHARCYVANFRTESTIPVDRLPYALNTHLPVDIVVTKGTTTVTANIPNGLIYNGEAFDYSTWFNANHTLTNIAVILLALSCIINSINLGILRREITRIYSDLFDITEALNNLAQEKDENKK